MIPENAFKLKILISKSEKSNKNFKCNKTRNILPVSVLNVRSKDLLTALLTWDVRNGFAPNL